jgi:hypothetical protein
MFDMTIAARGIGAAFMHPVGPGVRFSGLPWGWKI